MLAYHWAIAGAFAEPLTGLLLEHCLAIGKVGGCERMEIAERMVLNGPDAWSGFEAIGDASAASAASVAAGVTAFGGCSPLLATDIPLIGSHAPNLAALPQQPGFIY